MKAALLSRDLYFGSQISAAAAAAGWQFEAYRTPADLSASVADQTPANLVLLDLNHPEIGAGLSGLVATLRNGPHRPGEIIAYGPHVQRSALDDAKSAGCDRVLTRGQLHQSLQQLFA